MAERDGRTLGYAYAGAFKERPAYDWDVETTIYVVREERRAGIGRILLLKLEEILAAMNITNVNACIASSEREDEYLTQDSILFHRRMGYSMVGCFHLLNSLSAETPGLAPWEELTNNSKKLQ